MKIKQPLSPNRATIYQEFPKFEILPLEKLFPHEFNDAQRTPPLVEKLRSSGVMINPPLVSPFNDGSGEYMILDGANRLAAFIQMDFPHLLAQVVQPDSPSMNLSAWNHVIWGMPTEDLIKAVKEIPNAKLERSKGEQLKLQDDQILITIQTPDGSSYRLRIPTQEINLSVTLLIDVLNTYKDRSRFDRIPINEINAIQEMYKDLTALVTYPQFTIENIFELCRAGEFLPSGITRFIVYPRALRINYSLEELESGKPLEQKQETLRKWLQDMVAKKKVRFYTEATAVFDE